MWKTMNYLRKKKANHRTCCVLRLALSAVLFVLIFRARSGMHVSACLLQRAARTRRA